MTYQVNKNEPNGTLVVSASGKYKVTSGVYQPTGYDPTAKYNLWSSGSLYGVTNSKKDAMQWLAKQEAN